MKKFLMSVLLLTGAVLCLDSCAKKEQENIHPLKNLVSINGEAAESVDAYKAAVGWAGWGDKIKAIPEE